MVARRFNESDIDFEAIDADLAKLSPPKLSLKDVPGLRPERARRRTRTHGSEPPSNGATRGHSQAKQGIATAYGMLTLQGSIDNPQKKSSAILL